MRSDVITLVALLTAIVLCCVSTVNAVEPCPDYRQCSGPIACPPAPEQEDGSVRGTLNAPLPVAILKLATSIGSIETTEELPESVVVVWQPGSVILTQEIGQPARITTSDGAAVITLERGTYTAEITLAGSGQNTEIAVEVRNKSAIPLIGRMVLRRLAIRLLNKILTL